jgi:hypothetical protein
VGLVLDSADTLRDSAEPRAYGSLAVGVVGLRAEGPADVEGCALAAAVGEHPVGNLDVAFAVWLTRAGRLPPDLHGAARHRAATSG